MTLIVGQGPLGEDTSVSDGDEVDLWGTDDVREAPSESESATGSDDSGCLAGLLDALDARRQKGHPSQAPAGPSSEDVPDRSSSVKSPVRVPSPFRLVPRRSVAEMITSSLPEGGYDRSTISDPLNEFENHYLDLIGSVKKEPEEGGTMGCSYC